MQDQYVIDCQGKGISPYSCGYSLHVWLCDFDELDKDEIAEYLDCDVEYLSLKK